MRGAPQQAAGKIVLIVVEQDGSVVLVAAPTCDAIPYDKMTGLAKEVPIKAVAQRPNYFDAQTEKALNDVVERPA
jgi:hypothetical protein